jgi:hypothetical protein
MAAAHPIITAGIVVALLILAILLIVKLFRFFRQVVGRLTGRQPLAEAGSNPPAHAHPQAPRG